MPLTYSYPGIYIQELPLSTHTITPAPTSITAFVGYTHPWKTATFKTAIQLFSFSDYETYFGGLYTSGYFDNDVAQAVYAFFLNGGNNAYVVGLQPEALSAGPAVKFGNDPSDYAFQATIHPDPLILGVGMQFYALEPGDIVPMTATITNLRTSSSPTTFDTFDLILPTAHASRSTAASISPSTRAWPTASTSASTASPRSSPSSPSAVPLTARASPIPRCRRLPPSPSTSPSAPSSPIPRRPRRSPPASPAPSAPPTSSTSSRPTPRSTTCKYSTFSSSPASPTTPC